MRSSSYRLRTIWTPEMDRYFVCLMLEQVGKENMRGDHLFSKRAWKHMTTLFNVKFNSKYEKDVLKNRHKMLRNLCRALRNLLEQKGFRWDETRQMVTAENSVWDDYIKAHPSVRPYRKKTIPYYSDLCKIYGTVGIGGNSTVSMQKASCDENTPQDDVCCSLSEGGILTSVDDDASKMAVESLHDIMIGEDYEISMAKGAIDEQYQFLSDIGSSVGARTRTYWQPPMDRYFVDLMSDQVNQGNHVDGLLRKQAWREMIKLFNAKFWFNYGVDILKNRYKTIRRQHNAIKHLLELDGFAWDDARQMVVADDCVWQNYIKAHTDARQYMTRPIPYLRDLCSIFAQLNGDEKDAISSHRSPAASTSGFGQFHKENETSSSHSDFNMTPTNQMNKRLLEIPPTAGSSKKSRARNAGLAHAICEMTTVVSSLADERKEDENSNDVPVEHVVAAIQALPGMDEDLVLDACDLLEDEKKAKTFMALDVKLRKKWLLRKLRPCGDCVA